ncbi:YbhB/YbcL family Raf kinase inhibitor-like protein [Rickettsiales endosymbiont of Stachyamoeba lipophora]|uniref:YbhB/YbcL family Raf kinase inhibitor-like protein n=1 Tax=Rickettsiales endosymbiont of Stachyamoeba lipophora TaxID=2486578 RepID=UPI000F64C439|nr:YbhB/YbcL family Raf kinase inhibitor-like protein [Rickettsiales endosymbiont of Stachyamoeba lipophora]AZL16268.1 YbhB/YbcL family Raf kinase inhibitor-like protein [Rickettsiales endosymbiont of Stachyamoeba lipophora]
MGFTIKSISFEHNGIIPQKFTCDGANISPELEWSSYPQEANSFVLIVDDPDAPNGVWDHFIAFNISKYINRIEENEIISTLANSAVIAKNSWNDHGYGPPCPPKGKEHRYYFKIYALDTMLDLSSNSTKAEILRAMDGHTIAQAALIGRYQK